MAALQQRRRVSKPLFAITGSSLSHNNSNNNNRTLTTLTRFTSNWLSSLDCLSAADLQSCPWSVLQRRGVKVNASHQKPGNVIKKSGGICQVVDAEHKQRGRGGAMMTLELRDVDSGSRQSLRFGTEESVETVHMFVHRKQQSIFNGQLEVPLDLFGKAAPYLKEEMKVKLQLYDGRPLSVSIPKQITCTVKEIQSSATHRAVLDNDLTIQVPSFLKPGEQIIVNIEDNSYISK